MRLYNILSKAILSLSLCVSSVYANSKIREPLNYVTLVEDAKIRTPSNRVHAYSSFDLTFDLHNHEDHFRLSLEPNYDILHSDAQVTLLDENGNVKAIEKINREDHKVYQGKSYSLDKDGFSEQVGWARIVVRRDGLHPIFEGAFTVFGNHHHIQMKSTYLATKHLLDPKLEENDDEYMVVWRDTDVGRLSHTELRKRVAQPDCAADSLPFNSDLRHPVYQELLKRDQSRWAAASIEQLLGKRQNIDGGGAGNGNGAGVNLRSSIGDTSGCPKTRQVALIGVATDCSYFADFNKNRDNVQQNVITVVNTASDLYQSTFNITLGLRNLTIQEQDCTTSSNSATPWNVDCSNNVDMTQRLNLFSQWRAQQGDTNAYWSLFTKCNTGSEVGLAWLGQLCNHGGTNQQSDGQTQTVTGANVIARLGSEWQVFAHESGHTFGAVHDCTSSSCGDSNTVSSSQCCPLSQTACDAGGQYLMNPFSSTDITRFSPCSIGNICSALGRNSVSSSCLTDNKGVVTVTGPVCGNGIVEGDEQCDCGGEEGCQGNTCCDPTTCRYTANAICDWSNEGCCSRQCQHQTNGTVCRASTGACDPEETCPGDSGVCPEDRKEDDGSGCGNGLQCASGQCTSRDQQCRTVMGTTSVGNDTYACNSQTCMISCGSPDFGPSTCYQMQQNFLDGTPCNGGGRCQNGVCAGASVGGQIRSWIDDNRTLFICLVSVVGGLVLIGMVCCIITCCRRRRAPKRSAAPRRPPMGQQYGSAPYFQPPPPSYGGYTGPTVRYA